MWIIPLRLLDGASAVGTVVPPPPVGLPDLSIQNFYAVDYKTKRRRPLTEEEWKLVRQWWKICRRVKLKYLKDLSASRELEQKAEAMLKGEKRKRRAAKVGPKGRVDPSGLWPRQRRQRRS